MQTKCMLWSTTRSTVTRIVQNELPMANPASPDVIPNLRSASGNPGEQDAAHFSKTNPSPSGSAAVS